MVELSLSERIKSASLSLQELRGYLDFEAKKSRLEDINISLQDPEIWSNQEETQKLGKEKSSLEKLVALIENLNSSIDDLKELFDLVGADEKEADQLKKDLLLIEEKIMDLEFRRMFSGKMDQSNSYLDIQSGSGGTEAQDWAEMLLRMYLRWGENKGFKTELIEVSPGDVAGIKSATIKFDGDFAYGWLRTESGVHRLVRKSPFDSGNRRHTSFASIFVSPEVDDEIQVDLNPADIRIDTYRASGAGGQHVNKTDSAVRLTHIPSGIVVQCQTQRSQHKNKDSAMKQLRAKLFEIELKKQQQEMENLEATKSDIGWGSQIRSYVLDSARIKDLRTGVETGNCNDVLDGNLDMFIEASLKQGIE
ncbi:peptide chain release factor 2 [SAR86 cluster bacterium]|nr:peptide chain release factor 2 [SAR86 cluster bacterium]